ncbi:MAG: YdcF family protein [Luteolibacter sp.]
MRRKRLLISLAAVALLLVTLYLGRAPILRAAADLWIIDQAPVRADVIIIPGGGLQNRPAAAARLFHRGFAPEILIFRVKPNPATDRGLVPTEQEITRSLLIAEGVPAAAIVEIGRDVASTWDEALAVRDWAAAHHPRSILVTTEPFHTRRARWTFRKTLSTSMFDVRCSRLAPLLALTLDQVAGLFG